MKHFLGLFCLIFLLSSMSFSQWIPQNTNTTQRLMTVFFLNENIGWAGGTEGCILKTTDGGISWNNYSIETLYTVHAVTFVDSLNGWAALYHFTPGPGGYIAATTDGGVNWHFQYYVDGVTLHNIDFYDQFFGWAVGSSGTFLRTVDGGVNWQNMTYYNPSYEWIYGFDFINENVGWISNGYAGSLLKTTDGGFNWQYEYVPSNARMMSIKFLNNNLGWAAGGNGDILKTTNGGNNWILQNSGVSQELRDIKFVNENDGWAVGYGGIILHTTNGGTNWFLQSSSTNNDLFSVSFYNQNIGWVAGDSGLVLNTENGGGSHQPITVGAPNGGESWLIGSSHNITWLSYGVANVKIELSLDNGVSWNEIISSTPSSGIYSWTIPGPQSLQALVKISDSSDSTVFDISNNIFTITLTSDIGSYNDTELSSEFYLYENYPNPFNPVTVIKYQLPFRFAVTLKVFDTLGNEIAILVNEEKEAGYYQIDFDASKLSSGIYYYTLQTENNSITKKMMLLK